MKLKILSVVGARPNFMKIAPFTKAIKKHNQSLSVNPGAPSVDHLLVHTGQHYDIRMSRSFFEDLEIQEPDINLEIGSGTHAEQVGHTMIEFEKVLRSEKPDWVVVVGDVNATLACSVTAKKELVRVCHIEAGLRSGDMTMPEEINRLVTDRLADLLLTPDLLSSENLRNEGVSDDKIGFVGNIMIDTLEANRDRAANLKVEKIIENNSITNLARFASHNWDNDAIGSRDYAVITLHRPSNVDLKEVIVPLFRVLTDEVAETLPLIWPIHPRTEKMMKEYGIWEEALAHPNITLLHPIGYLEMLRLNMDARIMLTDSGGLQEECTVLGTPCLTMRWNTERPITLREHGGASVLVGNNVERIKKEFLATLKITRQPVRPDRWDGHTAERCLKEILNFRL